MTVQFIDIVPVKFNEPGSLIITVLDCWNNISEVELKPFTNISSSNLKIRRHDKYVVHNKHIDSAVKETDSSQKHSKNNIVNSRKNSKNLLRDRIYHKVELEVKFAQK